VKKINDMSNQYEMDVLKTILNEAFGVEITKRTNKREAVNARKIFSKILSERGYTRSEVGRYLKKDHSTIVHYMYDVDDMIKYTDGMAEKYVTSKNAFLNAVDKTTSEESKEVVSLKMRIDELLLDREKLKQKVDKYYRLREIIDFLDYVVPNGKEFFILKKIRLMFNSLKDYGEQLE
jgi:hypothetical protein